MREPTPPTPENSASTTAELESWIERIAAEAEPPNPELLSAYVDGDLDQETSRLIEDWIADDPAIAAEVWDLRRLRAQLGDTTTAWAPPRWWRAVAVAAVLALSVATIGWWWFGRTGILLHDGDRTLVVGRDSIRGLEHLPPELADDVREVVRSGRLPELGLRDHLRPPAEMLLSTAAADRDGPSPRSPVATVVRNDRPHLSWHPVPGARHYRVLVADPELQVVARSEELNGTVWEPPDPLPRGVPLRWQVTAELVGGEVTAPIPPEPEARFLVLDRQSRESLEVELARTGGSHLAAALLLVRAGLREEAVRHLEALQQQNPHSEVVRELHRSLQL